MNAPRMLKDNLSFEGVKSYTPVFDCVGGRSANRVVQGSTVQFN